MGNSYTFKEGRIWARTGRLSPFKLLLPYGMTGVTDPAGSMTPVREPDPGRRRESIITDIIKGEPGLSTFQIETRIHKTLNYLFSLKNRKVDFQSHQGSCDRADNYLGSEIGFYWEAAQRGDLAIDRLALIEGDDAPSALTVPFTAEVGPMPIDFELQFLSRRTFAGTRNLTSLAFLSDVCYDDKGNILPGTYGYMAEEGAVATTANIYHTSNSGDTWTAISSDPFAADEDPVELTLYGTLYNHRVFVGRGTTDGANPAEIAYIDRTNLSFGSWNLVELDTANGDYVTAIFVLDYGHIYVGTNLGEVHISRDGGASFELLYTAANGIADIKANRNGVVVIVDVDVNVSVSRDFGDNFTDYAPTIPGTPNLSSCHVCEDDTILLGYADGSIYGSFDYVATVNMLTIQGITATNVSEFHAMSNMIIYALIDVDGGSSRVVRSTDGGVSFHLFDLAVPTNSGLNGLYVVNDNHVAVCGNAHSGTGFMTRAVSKSFAYLA